MGVCVVCVCLVCVKDVCLWMGEKGGAISVSVCVYLLFVSIQMF